MANFMVVSHLSNGYIEKMQCFTLGWNILQARELLQ